MAKWGEGDPRWIVEERADAKNVNNWHWTEKNATLWSVDKIKSLLVGYTIDTGSYFVEIKNVSKCDGEAVANNRKGKLIFFYEWTIEAEWSGHKKNGNNKTKFTGKITVNNLSEEYAANELDFDVSCDSSSADADDVKEFVRKDGSNYLRQQLGMYITDLKHEYSKNLILPTRDKEIEKSNFSSSTTPKRENASDAIKKVQITSAKSVTATTSKTTDITMKENFMCTPEDLYKVFITEDLTKMFTRGNATVQATCGGKYEIFGGNVTGNFIELSPNKMISMSWRKGNWPAGHQSLVKLEFSPSDGGTGLKVTQTNVPLSDKEGTSAGWKSHYFAPIQQTFGFGGRMF